MRGLLICYLMSSGNSLVFMVILRHLDKTQVWNLLESQHSFDCASSLCFGDFNEILMQDEKLGGAYRPINQIMAFRNFIDHCQLIDLGFLSFPFTWCNQREGGDRISEWSNRFLETAEWVEYFPKASVKHLPTVIWLELQQSFWS